MLERVRHMMRKEFIQVLRDPRTRFFIFGVPIIQTVIFGYAVTTDVRHVATAVYDLDNSVASRELVGRFVESGYFDAVARVADDASARELIDRGAVQMVLRINHGFGTDLVGGRTATVQVIMDGTDSNTAGIALSYVASIAGDYSQQVLVEQMTRLRGAVGRPGEVDLRTRAWFNENLQSRNFYVPGVIVLLVTLITLLLTSLAVVREKEMGTIEQIMVTPISRFEFVLGKTAPFAIIGFLDVLLITLVAMFIFHVPIRGSILLILLATGLYLLTSLSLGLLISTISSTQQQAMMSVFFFFMPAVLLSGFIFPIANMPLAVQWLTFANPMRYFVTIVRGVFLKGIGADVVWPQMLALLFMGFLLLLVTAKRFHKTLS